MMASMRFSLTTGVGTLYGLSIIKGMSNCERDIRETRVARAPWCDLHRKGMARASCIFQPFRLKPTSLANSPAYHVLLASSCLFLTPAAPTDALDQLFLFVAATVMLALPLDTMFL
jgi:hypothetical protein